MAIGISNRSVSWASMAAAFVAGLTYAALLTLLITPAKWEFSLHLKSFIGCQSR